MSTDKYSIQDFKEKFLIRKLRENILNFYFQENLNLTTFLN